MPLTSTLPWTASSRMMFTTGNSLRTLCAVPTHNPCLSRHCSLSVTVAYQPYLQCNKSRDPPS